MENSKTIAIDVISSKDNDEECAMHSKKDNMEIMCHDKADQELLKNFFNHFFPDIKFVLETLMKGSDFVFDFVNLLYFKCHKINLNRGGSYGTKYSRVD